MDKQAREEMIREENEAVFTQLIAEIGWVFHHPILREWVKVAPSVNSVDKWISNQFKGYEHKLELVRAMRKAVRAWSMEKDKKNLLETPKNWRLADMFIFQTPSIFPRGAGEKEFLEFASGIKFLPDTEKAISCKDWPMLLKEFGHKWGNGLKTSADCSYGDANRFRRVKKIGEKFWKDGEAEAFVGNSKELTDFGYNLQFETKELDNGDSIAWVDILLKQFGIASQIIQVEPGPGEIYPRFYKTLFFCDRRYGDAINSIKIFWPIDCYQDSQSGRVIFSKSIKICEHVSAILKLEYEFENSFKLIAWPSYVSYDPCSHIKLQISHVEQGLLFQKSRPAPETKKIAEAIGILFEDFIKVWEFSIKQPNILLEAILGEPMMKSFYDNLLQIFTGSKIADDLSCKSKK